MEGRWAQLTLDAHIAGAIDYTKPVKPFIEHLVLDRMDALRQLSTLSLYPLRNADTERDVLLSAAWVDDFRDKYIEPWKAVRAKSQEEQDMDFQDKINYLTQVNQNLLNIGRV